MGLCILWFGPRVCVVAEHHDGVIVEAFHEVPRVVALQNLSVAAVSSVHALHPHAGADSLVVLPPSLLVHPLRAVLALVKSRRARRLVLPEPSQRHGLAAVLTLGALVPAHLLVRHHLDPWQRHRARTRAFILEPIDKAARDDLVKALREVVLDAGSRAHPLAPRPVRARERAVLAKPRVRRRVPRLRHAIAPRMVALNQAVVAAAPVLSHVAAADPPPATVARVGAAPRKAALLHRVRAVRLDGSPITQAAHVGATCLVHPPQNGSIPAPLGPGRYQRVAADDFEGVDDGDALAVFRRSLPGPFPAHRAQARPAPHGGSFTRYVPHRVPRDVAARVAQDIRGWRRRKRGWLFEPLRVVAR